MDLSWRDPSAAWWAKARRADEHIRDLSIMVREFERGRPYEVRQENTEVPGEASYSFHLLKPMPGEMLTVVGDALHNLRSCLDSVAYELARRHVGNNMTERQQAASQFPIYETGEEFDAFFEDHRTRRELYGSQEREALRCVQPFSLREEAARVGVKWNSPPEYDYITNELHRLRVLSNLDKHRRLPLLAWYVDFLYWNDESCNWRYAQHPHTALQDNATIGYLSDPCGNQPTAEVTFEFRLSLTDDPGFRQDLIGTLTRWQSYLTGWVIPRIFIVAEGNPPPILIGA